MDLEEGGLTEAAEACS